MSSALRLRGLHREGFCHQQRSSSPLIVSYVCEGRPEGKRAPRLVISLHEYISFGSLHARNQPTFSQFSYQLNVSLLHLHHLGNRSYNRYFWTGSQFYVHLFLRNQALAAQFIQEIISWMNDSDLKIPPGQILLVEFQIFRFH